MNYRNYSRKRSLSDRILVYFFTLLFILLVAFLSFMVFVYRDDSKGCQVICEPTVAATQQHIGINEIPEPGTLVLMGVGVVGLVITSKNKLNN